MFNSSFAFASMLFGLVAFLGACGTAPVENPRPEPTPEKKAEEPAAKKRGLASWYGRALHGKRTASGEKFNMFALTAAHRTLPLGSRVKVTELKTGRTVTVRINDRGPFSGKRIIDLSYAAARALGIVSTGVAQVELRLIPEKG